MGKGSRHARTIGFIWVDRRLKIGTPTRVSTPFACSEYEIDLTYPQLFQLLMLYPAKTMRPPEMNMYDICRSPFRVGPHKFQNFPHAAIFKSDVIIETNNASSVIEGENFSLLLTRLLTRPPLYGKAVCLLDPYRSTICHQRNN